MWCLDIDGTLTPPSEHVSAPAVALLKAIVSHVTLITAQALDYCVKINVGDFPNLVTEKGFLVRIAGHDNVRPAPLEVPGLVKEMEALLAKLGGGLFINVKQAGYAVGHPAGPRPAIFDEVVALMKEQSGRYDAYVVEETAGFVDITLADLSKASSLQAVMERFPGYIPIAAGDSPNTDGPMLRQAAAEGGNGVMVTKKLAPFPTVPGPDDMLALLAWYKALI